MFGGPQIRDQEPKDACWVASSVSLAADTAAAKTLVRHRGIRPYRQLRSHPRNDSVEVQPRRGRTTLRPAGGSGRSRQPVRSPPRRARLLRQDCAPMRALAAAYRQRTRRIERLRARGCLGAFDQGLGLIEARLSGKHVREQGPCDFPSVFQPLGESTGQPEGVFRGLELTGPQFDQPPAGKCINGPSGEAPVSRFRCIARSQSGPVRYCPARRARSRGSRGSRRL